MAATQTASRAGVYVPPGATGRASGTPTDTSATTTMISFGTSTSQPRNTYNFLHYFIMPYLEAHVLSVPSWRYAYFFWIAIGCCTVLWSLSHQLKRSAGSNFVSVFLRRLTVRRVTWGSRSVAPRSSDKAQWQTMTFGQLITILGLTGIVLATSLVGADYLAPTTCTFGGYCGTQVFKSGPPKSTFTRLAKRHDALESIKLNKREPALPVPGSRVQFVRRRDWQATKPRSELVERQEEERSVVLEPRGSALSLNPNGYAPFNDPLLAAPNYLIQRKMWTISSRLGLIAYAMLPLCVSLSLKMWPFALYATPWLTGYGYDKTGLLHRWMGRLVWVLSTAHTVTFAFQLSWDYDPFDRPILMIVWEYYRFTWGAIAYVALTFMVLLSFNPLRKKYYEAFYYSHCALTVVFLVGCIIHYQPLWAWATIAIVMWGAERAARLIMWFYINGLAARSVGPLHFWGEGIGRRAMAKQSSQQGDTTSRQGVPYNQVYQSEADLRSIGSASPAPTLVASSPSQHDRAKKHKRESLHAYGFQQGTSTSSPYSADYEPRSPTMSPPTHHMSNVLSSPPPRSSSTWTEKQASSNSVLPLRSTIATKVTSLPSPPPGFAIAQLLPGHTVKLTLHTPIRLKWRPGQSVLLCVPSVKWWQTHPYTISCADPGQDSKEGGGSEIVFLIRSRGGFTKSLFNYVTQQRQQLEAGNDKDVNGILVRAQVSWPMGSSGRIRWHWYSSVVIVCGGSGVSFGSSVLESLCRRLAGCRDQPKNGKTSRIRFVWIVREYAHLAWVAPVLRRCMEMVNPSQLRVDIHVTGSPRLLKAHPSQPPLRDMYDVEKGDLVEQVLSPPSAPFTKHQASRSNDSSAESEDETSSADIYDYYSQDDSTNRQIDQEGEEEEDVNLTEFDGETRHRTGKEKRMSAHIRQQGKVRRALSRQIKRGGGQDTPKAVGISAWDTRSFGSTSQTGLIHSNSGRVENLGDEDEKFIDVSESERQDLDIVAELVQSGKPKLGVILDEELGKSSTEAVIVTCCGPLTLNNLVRKLVGQRLGKHKGLEVFTEEFSY